MCRLYSSLSSHFNDLMDAAITADQRRVRGLSFGQQVLAAVLEELLHYMWTGRGSYMESIIEACGLYHSMDSHNFPIFSPPMFSFPEGKMAQVNLRMLLHSDLGKKLDLAKMCPISGQQSDYPSFVSTLTTNLGSSRESPLLLGSCDEHV